MGASYLNQHRMFTHDGGRWGIGQVHRIVTRPTYVGRHEFNKRAKSKALKPISETVTVEVPPLLQTLTASAGARPAMPCVRSTVLKWRRGRD
jgi:hypothetical protein